MVCLEVSTVEVPMDIYFKPPLDSGGGFRSETAVT